MATTIRSTVMIELNHERVTVDGDDLTVRAHCVPHYVFAALHKLGWNDGEGGNTIRSFVVLNGMPVTLAEIRGCEMIVFKRMAPLEALALAGVA